jgi:tetratricopeptide (TPR) repeat protein
LSAGKPERARQLSGEAIGLYEQVSNLRGLADAYEQLGAINLAERHSKEAVSCLERSLLLRRQLGNKHGEASGLYRLAVAHLALGHLTTAIPLLWQSLHRYQRLGVLSRQRLIRVCWQLFSFL